MEIHEVTIAGLSRSTVVELVPLGDIHLGTINCDLEELKRTVRYIDRTPYCYWIGMGDYVEAIKMKHVRDRRFDRRTVPAKYQGLLKDLVEEQAKDLVAILAPILTPEKCIGLHGGNHEEMYLLEEGADIVGDICKERGLKNLGYQALTRLHFQRKGSNDPRSYTVHSQHGHGGGRKPGSKLNNLRDIVADIEADVHIMGHVHQIITDAADRIRLAAHVLKLVVDRKVFGCTGTFYKTYQEGVTNYGERQGYSPTCIGTIKISFSPWARSPKKQLRIEELAI